MDAATPMETLPAQIVRALVAGLVLAGEDGWPTAADALAATLRLGGIAALAACALTTLLACLLHRPAAVKAPRVAPLTPHFMPAAASGHVDVSRSGVHALRRVFDAVVPVGRGAGALALYGLVLAVSLLGTRTATERAQPEPVRELGRTVQPPAGTAA